MPRTDAPLFTFMLGPSESIGPAALRKMWQCASLCMDVSVGRQEQDGRKRPVYLLYARDKLPDLDGVETRLRHLLREANVNATLMSLS